MAKQGKETKSKETKSKEPEKPTIASMMHETRVFPPSKEFSERAYVKSMREFEEISRQAAEDSDRFWAEKAEETVEWYKKWKMVYYWDPKSAKCTWFEGGKLNVSYNCLDRHLKTWRKNKAAIVWQGEPAEDTVTYTYQQLYYEVCRFANVLKKQGVKKGDRVCIYLPMIPQLPIAMLACARIGAIHSVVFGGFSAEALAMRIEDSKSKILVTCDASLRSGKIIPMKEAADQAMEKSPIIGRVIVYKRTGSQVQMKPGRDFWWHEEMAAASPVCKPEILDAEDPLFILYTSGTTGKPKGVLHTTAGYLVYVALTTKWVFDIKDEDTFWCTADIGWVTGHSYIVYGPLALGATSLMFEGIPTYPNPDRFWEIVEKYRVNIFYTAPTAIRALARFGEEWPNKHDLSSLRLLGTVGEPINPEAWIWYHKNIGKERCPIVDTWWQTETGGILITPIPGAIPTKPGSATKAFPGVFAEVFNEQGKPAAVNEGGYLVLLKPWPGMMRTVYGQHERFKETYFTRFPDVYFTGDAARKDEDGYYWIMGRIDDVVNVSGHRIGTAEVESALVSHNSVAEAAVVPIPHDIKGQALYAFVTLKQGVQKSEQLKNELVQQVAKEISPIARPDKIQFADALPKTRSGKIMRRVLRAIAEGKTISEVGDTTTLADPGVVDTLIKERV